MKKILATIVTLTLLTAFVLSPLQSSTAEAESASIWHGSADSSWYRNTSAKEYTIRTAEELAGLANIVNGGETFEGKTIYLERDIVLNEGDSSTWEKNPPKNVWTPIGTNGKGFRGTFDGRGHTISGMYISCTKKVDNTGNYQQALFGLVAQYNPAAAAPGVRNVSVVNAHIHNEAAEKVALLIGQCYVDNKVTQTQIGIENIYVQGSISTTYQGARVGGVMSMMNLQTNSPSTIVFRNCVSDVDISSESVKMAAGIVSSNVAGTKYAPSNDIFENCVNLGDLVFDSSNKGQKAGSATVGGIYGNTSAHANVTLTNCVNAGHIQGQKAGAAIGSVSMTQAATLKVTRFINLGEVDYIQPNYKSAGAIYGGGTFNNAVTGLFEQIYSVPVENGESAKIYEKSVLTSKDILTTLASDGFDTTGWFMAENVAPMPKMAAAACDIVHYDDNRLVAVQNTAPVNGLMNVRLVGGIDSLDYKKVGFRVVVNEAQESSMDTSVVSTSIAYSEENVAKKLDSYTGFMTPYAYFDVLENLSATATVTIKATPYFIDKKGNRTDGEEYTVVYENGVLKKATYTKGGLTVKDDTATGYNKPTGAAD